MAGLPIAYSGHADLQAFESLTSRANHHKGPYPVSATQIRLAKSHLTATLTLQIIATLVLLARIYTRAFPVWRFTSDDYVISVAYVCTLWSFGFQLYEVGETSEADAVQVFMSVAFTLWFITDFWAWGTIHPEFRTIDQVVFSTKVGSFALPFWAWSTGLVKISIGLMLLRFQQSKRWRIVIYTMISLNILLILLVGVINLFNCIPYSANWDYKTPSHKKRCWGLQANKAMVYSSAVCNFLTDVIYSLMPLTFLSKIRRPLPEKIVVGALMALGLVASTFSLSKAIVNGRLFGAKADRTSSFLLLGMLSCLEVQSSLIAACAPTLRNSSKRFFQRIGLANEVDERPSPPPYAGGSDSTKAFHQSHQMRLNRVQSHSVDNGADSPSSLEGAHARGRERDPEEEHYEMDPQTGRIICTTELRVHKGRSFLDDGWVARERWDVEDDWKAKKAVLRNTAR